MWPGARYWCTRLRISHRLALMIELIKTQIASIFGKKLKFINSSPFNIFFSGCKTKIELKCEKYGPKWDHFLTARVTFTVQPRILWDFSVSVNGTLETFLHRGQ